MSTGRVLPLLAVLMLILIMPFCLLTAGLAEETCPSNTCPTDSSLIPTGSGPAEVAREMSVAPIGVIMQRGYVNNPCEAQLVTMDTINRNGAMGTTGDYKVAYFLGAPIGSYVMKSGKLVWVTPSAKLNQHIDVIVMDSLTGMPIPLSPIKVEVVDTNGKLIDSRKLDYVWTPMGEHYGSNFTIPCAGNYTLRISAPVPNFLRHSRQIGNRFTCALNAKFSNVMLKPTTCSQPVGAGPFNPDNGPAPSDNSLTPPSPPAEGNYDSGM